jgi:hypothetical protein
MILVICNPSSARRGRLAIGPLFPGHVDREERVTGLNLCGRLVDRSTEPTGPGRARKRAR